MALGTNESAIAAFTTTWENYSTLPIPVFEVLEPPIQQGLTRIGCNAINLAQYSNTTTYVMIDKTDNTIRYGDVTYSTDNNQTTILDEYLI